MDISLHVRKAGLYWNTVRYLRAAQIFGRLKRLFHKPQIKLDVAAERSRQIVGTWHQPAKRAPRMVGEQTFCFLNQTNSIQSSADWNNSQWEKLWLYNLHYFDDLMAIDAECRDSWHHALIRRWIEENPPGVGNGWEPYPTSLRIVNWIKWELAGNQLEDGWLNSLAVQAAWLEQNLETHLLGNHLFANAKALVFAGLFLQEEKAGRWYEIGWRLIEQELPEQVLRDGGNFERSTMYHQIFLEDLLDLLNIHSVYQRELPNVLGETITRMIDWMKTMCHPDGEIAFFNDAALGVAPAMAEIRGYAERLGFSLSDGQQSKLDFVDLPDSGYSRVDAEDAVMIVDRAAIGPDYLPGHAHADTLSFELSLFGQRVVVNSGTSVYGTGAQRQIERGTAAHSTITVDDENSSEIWGGFRVARRARIKDREHHNQDGMWRLSASHDGYSRLSGAPVHHREWKLEKRQLIIQDKVAGSGSHHVAVVLPLHPKISVNNEGTHKAVLDVDHHSVEIVVEGKGELRQRASHYHPEFGRSVDNVQLVYGVEQTLPVEITTRITW